MKKSILCLLLVTLAAMPGQAQNLKALEESDRLFAEGVELYNAGNYEDAIQLFQKSDKIDKKQLDEGSNRRDYSAMWVASCYYKLGNEEEAKKWDPLYYNQSPIDRRLTVKSDALELSSEDHFITGEYQKAIDCFLEAAEIEKEALGEDNYFYANTLYMLGQCYTELGDNMNSADCALKAWRIRMKTLGLHHLYTAMSQTDVAPIYSLYGHNDIAWELETDDLEIFEAYYGQGNPYYATSLSNLAGYCQLLGKYDAAISFQTKAARIIAKVYGQFSLKYIEALSNLADYHSYIGNYAESIQIGEQALKICKKVSFRKSMYCAKILNDLSDYYSDSGDWKTAMKSQNNAVKTYKIFRYLCPNEYASSIASLSLFFIKIGDYAKATQLNLDAMKFLESTVGTENMGYYSALSALATCNYTLGDYSEAIRREEEAIQILNTLSLRDKTPIISSLTTLIRFYMASGNYAKAGEYAVSATNVTYSVIRETFANLTSNERSRFWNKYRDWFDVHLPLLTFRIQTDSIKSIGYDASLMSKGLLLNSEIELGNLLLESGNEKAVIKYYNMQQNRMTLNKLYEQPVAERRMDVDSLENVVNKLEEELLQLSKTYGDYTKNLSVSWQQVQEGLGDKDVAIEFLDIDTGDGHSYVALTLTKNDTIPQLAYLFDKKDLESVDKSEYYTSSAVSDLVWKPLAQTLQGKENIYFSPAGELYNIAIESLPDYEGTWLISDRWNFYRLSSTRELALVRDKQQIDKADVYGGLQYSVGASVLVDDAAKYRSMDSVGSRQTVDADTLGLRGGVSDLPGTKVEADKIDRIIGTTKISKTLYTDTIGTEASFKALSSQKTNILHIATHGFYWTDSEAQERHKLRFLAMSETGSRAKYTEDKMMTRSGLLFAGANYALSGRTLPEGVDDGVLTAKEISVLDLRGLDLVVLSACQTGLGEITGDGVFGLQRGFKKAGANSIVMSLWKVEDDATQIFMAHFYYDLLCEKMTKRAAFFDAQHYLRTVEDGKYDKPECWAAFILLDALDG